MEVVIFEEHSPEETGRRLSLHNLYPRCTVSAGYS